MNGREGSTVLDMTISVPPLPRRVSGASLPPAVRAVGRVRMPRVEVECSNDEATLAYLLVALRAWQPGTTG
jgi:hypothetical protein